MAHAAETTAYLLTFGLQETTDWSLSSFTLFSLRTARGASMCRFTTGPLCSVSRWNSVCGSRGEFGACRLSTIALVKYCSPVSQLFTMFTPGGRVPSQY
jgi:hypothetical protein